MFWFGPVNVLYAESKTWFGWDPQHQTTDARGLVGIPSTKPQTHVVWLGPPANHISNLESRISNLDVAPFWCTIIQIIFIYLLIPLNCVRVRDCPSAPLPCPAWAQTPQWGQASCGADGSSCVVKITVGLFLFLLFFCGRQHVSKSRQQS